MNKIRKGNCVIIRTGKGKGKQGTVLAVLAEHVMVEGVNVAKKHVRPNPMLGTTGGAVDKVIPIHVSSVALVDANDKLSRVGIKVGDGVRTRALKTTGAAVGAWSWTIKRS